MKVTFNTDKLKDIANKIKPFTSSNYVDSAITNHIFIECVWWIATISSIDFDASIKCVIDYEWDDINITIPSKGFIAIVNNIPSEKITLKVIQWEVVISWGNKKLKLPTLDLKRFEYSKIENNSIELDLNDNLVGILKSNVAIIPSKGFQQWMLWLSIKNVWWKLATFCTDYFWMLLSKAGNYEWDLDDLFLSKNAIEKILNAMDDGAKLLVWNKFIFFITKDTEISILKTDVQIPPFMNILKEVSDLDNIIEFDSKEMIGELSFIIKLYWLEFISIRCIDNKIYIEGEWFEEILIGSKWWECTKFNIDPRRRLVFLKRNKGNIKMYIDDMKNKIKFTWDNENELFILNKMM
jgi:DNA polymerase III sliding clamp (beta) subunit (PCNA family)